MIDIPGDLVWDLPCVQQASYLEEGPLMWMLPLYLHVNQKSDYDDMMLLSGLKPTQCELWLPWWKHMNSQHKPWSVSRCTGRCSSELVLPLLSKGNILKYPDDINALKDVNSLELPLLGTSMGTYYRFSPSKKNIDWDLLFRVMHWLNSEVTYIAICMYTVFVYTLFPALLAYLLVLLYSPWYLCCWTIHI